MDVQVPDEEGVHTALHEGTSEAASAAASISGGEGEGISAALPSSLCESRAK